MSELEFEKVLSSADEVLPDVMVYNYIPIVYISITAGVETTQNVSYMRIDVKLAVLSKYRGCHAWSCDAS